MTDKFEKIFFYIFLFSIPFQTRLILCEWTKPFNEWTASFLYLTDILLVAVLILWGKRLIFRKTEFIFSRQELFVVIFFAVCAFSIFGANLAELAWYRLIKLLEYSLLFFYLKNNLGKLIKLEFAALAIIGSGLFQAVIAITQYLKQGSIGLKILGESQIGINIYNVAVFITDNGHKYLRAYGTTPHPNVLAAWLTVSLFAFYYIFAKRSKKILPLIIYSLILFGFLFTFSRTMIGFWLLSVFVLFVIAKGKRKLFFPVLITTVAVGLIFAVSFWPQVKSRIIISGSEEAVTQRLLYNKIAGGVTISNPLLGVGIGQFTPDLMNQFRHYPAYFYQPVHNIYMLISSETGFIGLAVFLMLIFSSLGRLFKKHNLGAHYLLITTLCFLLIGFFDHFLWTLQQGSFVFWLILGMVSVDI